MNLLFRRRTKPDNNSYQSAQGKLADRFPDIPVEHIETYQSVHAATMTSAERVFALCDAVKYICNSNIIGDIVECGVWKGGSMMAAARTLLELGHQDRTLWLFDTFSGMTEPTKDDFDFSGTDADGLLAAEDPEDPRSVWCRSHLSEVKSNIADTGYPRTSVNFVEGTVESTLLDARNRPEKIALLRLDTDWYESTRVEMEQLFPRLVPGGVLIVDDYGHWEGCRKAVDEYLAKNQIKLFLQRIDYTGRIGIKQDPDCSKVDRHVA